MRSALVIVRHPCLSQIPHILQGPEDVCIEHSSAIASVKAFDDTVLSRMSRLDIDDVYVITLASLLEHL